MGCVCGHWLEGSVFLARVMLDGDNLEFGDFDDFEKLRTFCSDDFVS